MVQRQRGLMPAKPTSFYLPLFPWLQAQGRALAVDAILDLRRFITLLNVIGILWAAMLGRRCGGAPAGVLAAALWACSPFLLYRPTLATGEALAVPLLILTLLLAVQTLEPGRRWLSALLSLGVGALCFLAEVRLIVALFPGAAVLLWRARQRYRADGRELAQWGLFLLALVSVMIAVASSRLPERILSLVQATFDVHIWDMETFRLYVDKTFHLSGLGLPVTILLLAQTGLQARRAPANAPLRLPALLLTGATLLLTLWANSSFRPYGYETLWDEIRQRHILAPVALLFVLAAAALGTLVSAVSGRARALVTGGLAAYLLLFQLAPALEFVQTQRVLPWPVIVRRWADDNLAPGRILVPHDLRRWFDPHWHNGPWAQGLRLAGADILDRPLQEWIETEQITWLALPVRRQEQLQESAQGRELLAQLLPLRAFVGPPERREVEVALYRLWRMQQESDIRFGEHIRLSGYDVHDEAPGPGEAMDFTFYWNALKPPPENIALVLQLVAADGGELLAQVTGSPAAPERPTQSWDQADETLISHASR